MSDIRSRSSVARVTKQFEGWKDRVEKCHGESRDFRSLCEDYAICERALERWQASDSAMSSQRQQEYAELLAELRNEIHDWLAQQPSRDRKEQESGPR